ncbi:MAG: hypothetical protein KBD46_01715 [Candidatus Levybacteria bacterium]|nr:hypothetical protein [Candidatus Levybacteria bacterium]
MDTAQIPLLSIAIQAAAFIAAFAAVAAGVLMFSVTKKFGTGILASGFKRIAIGVSLIAAGIIIDSVQTYIVQTGTAALVGATPTLVILFIKDILFVAGTYTIVIGSKSTGDKLENLTSSV